MDDNKSKKSFPVEDMKEWLYRTSIKCESLKCHMDYMKLRCRDMQQDILEPKNEFDEQSYQDPKLKLFDTDGSVACGQLNYNDCLQKSCDVTRESTNNNGNLEDYDPCQSLKLGNIVPKINLQYKDREKMENKSYKERSGVEEDNFTFTSHPLLHSPRIKSTPVAPICEDILYEEQTENWHDAYQQHLSEYSAELMQNVGYSKKPFRELDLDNEDEYIHRDLPSAKHGIKLNIPGSVTHGSGGKSKVYRKNEKKEKTASSALPSKKGSVSKLDDIASLKFRKRRKKLCGSTSKSTVATRDTNFVGRKDAKRRKQKNVTSARLTSKYPPASKKVVEIYHNSAVKTGGTSASNSKHSRINTHATYINKLPVGTSKQQNVRAKPKCENNNYKYSYNNNEDTRPSSPLKHSPSRQKTEEKTTNSHDQNFTSECPIAPVHMMEKCNSTQCQQTVLQAQYCNPLTTRSYEMPTLASKLKRVNRSYFSRFTIRNIPFVVGTSINPSHNLGLNIQQVLSIMKTRQPTVNTIAPLLIQKVGATKPVSTFMGQMNDPMKLSQMNSQVINTLVHKANSFLSEPFNVFGNESIALSYGARTTLRNFDLNLNLTNANEAAVDDVIQSESFPKKKDTHSENQLNRWNTAETSQTADNARVKIFSSQQNVKTRTEVRDDQQIRPAMSKDYECGIDNAVCDTQSVNCSQNAKGIREVLINLHNQFEEMTTKYEKLQSELEKNNDTKLEEEVSSLEKELNTKEDEINTVVNLYKEVMTLKQQMKMLQEKNSYVCISSEIPMGLGQPHLPMPFMFTKSNGTILQQKLPQRRKSTTVTTKEPTSLRLAGLLRQIQTFQKQLRLSS